MTAKPVVPRKQARRDIDEAIAQYLAEAEEKVALAFIDALEDAYQQISEHPASGSLRYARELDLPGVRFAIVRSFPYLLFYVERETEIDLWRVLHGARDIPAWLWEPIED